MRGIKGKVVLIGETNPDAGADMARRSRNHSAERADGGGHTRIRSAQHPPMVLNGPHPHHVQVLPGRAGIAIPPVIGDIDQHLRSLLYELPHLIAEDRLITDKGAVGMAASRKDGSLLSGIKGAYLVEQVLRKE